jgi:hypothetical protein
MHNPLSWWRLAINAATPITRRTSRPRRRRPILTVERFEDRLTPATYQWTGAGGNALWSNPANWSPSSAFPSTGDIAQFYSGTVNVMVNGSFGASEIDVASGVTVNMSGTGPGVGFPSASLVDNGTVNIISGTGTGPGLAGTYYNFSSTQVTPQAAIGNLAAATAITGQVTAVNMTNAGAGYASPPTVIIPPPKAGGIPFAGFAVMNGVGGVSSVFIYNPGSGYTTADLVGGALPVTFTGGGATMQAQASANITTPGAVSSVILASVNGIVGGNGYGTTPPSVTFSGGGGTGAAGVAVLNTTGVVSPLFTITSGGVGYTSPPTVTITGGGGSGATAHAIIKNVGADPGGDPIIGIVLDNPGSGYSNLGNPGLSVTIAAPPAGGTQATATGLVQLPGSIASVQVTNGT